MNNNRQHFSILQSYERRVLDACPGMPLRPGIYVFYRDDETGLQFAYVGQAKKLLERCANHFMCYDHLGLSLTKRKFFSESNPYGWRLSYEECDIDDLDIKEKEKIREIGNKGYQLYNKTAGGQGEGKTKINEYKPAKGYRDGVKQGRKTLQRELNHIIDSYLDIQLKPEKQNNKTAQKQLEKFKTLLTEESK